MRDASSAKADGAELLALVEQGEPDLIILDIRIPGKDGLTVLREIRSTSRLPVIMLTASGDVIDKVLGLELGADDYLAKPFDIRALEARAKAAIRRSGIRHEE